ncbi:MAG: glutathione S-transferase N-terminal domain-containing protein [Acetobacteraceae bacterium]
MFDLHYWPTPNGKKVTILLEELGAAYRVIPCHIGRGDQFTPEFLKLNPNHRMPVLVDPAPSDGGGPLSLFESGAIMLYVAEKAGAFFPQDVRGKAEVTQWVIWQMANQGPKLGECGHFRRLGDTKGDQSYAVRRFTDEANRLYGVMNNRLYDRRYLAGDTYTIADMISYPWAVNWQAQGAGHRGVSLFQALARRGGRAPGGAARHGRGRGSGRGPGDAEPGGAGSADQAAL